MSLHDIIMQRAAIKAQNDFAPSNFESLLLGAAQTATDVIQQRQEAKAKQREKEADFERQQKAIDKARTTNAGKMEEKITIGPKGTTIEFTTPKPIAKEKPSATQLEAAKIIGTGVIPETVEESIQIISKQKQQEQQNKILEAKSKQEADLLQQNFANANVLRDDFVKESGNFSEVQDSFGRVLASTNDPSASGDLALIFNYMKMLDPGSVVRESEFANAAATGALGERFIAAGKKIAKGERLSQAMRKDFADRANKLYLTQRSIQKKRTDTYIGRAERAGVNPADVVFDIIDFDESGEVKSKKETFGSDVSFNSVEEAESANLPVGTKIIINGRRAVIE